MKCRVYPVLIWRRFSFTGIQMKCEMFGRKKKPKNFVEKKWRSHKHVLMPPLTSNGLKLLWKPKQLSSARHKLSYLFDICAEIVQFALDIWTAARLKLSCNFYFFVRLFVCLSIVSGYQKSRSALKSNKNKGNLAGFMRKFLSPNQKFILLTCKKVHELCFEIFSAHRKYCIRLWNCERGCFRKSGCANGIFHFAYFIYAILFTSVFLLSNIA